ncbi:ATP-dependent Clp protease proteolytic subunit [Patescibacteria group bacterium AH-259-L07]|nr:ATP-dependent Clp protease proteolytic subunit [Patescibacteria group bacterium AH-259-L07]
MRILEEKYGIQHECILNLSDPIEYGTIGPLCTNMENLLKDDKDLRIALKINSTGGYIVEATILADFVMLNNVNLLTLAIGLCQSAATFILQLGKPRLAFPHAKISLHGGILGHVELCDVDEVSGEMKQDVKFWQKIMAKRTGKSLKTIQKHCDEYRSFPTAQKALEYGLIDKILKG